MAVLYWCAGGVGRCMKAMDTGWMKGLVGGVGDCGRSREGRMDGKFEEHSNQK